MLRIYYLTNIILFAVPFLAILINELFKIGMYTNYLICYSLVLLLSQIGVHYLIKRHISLGDKIWFNILMILLLLKAYNFPYLIVGK